MNKRQRRDLVRRRRERDRFNRSLKFDAGLLRAALSGDVMFRAIRPDPSHEWPPEPPPEGIVYREVIEDADDRIWPLIVYGATFELDNTIVRCRGGR